MSDLEKKVQKMEVEQERIRTTQEEIVRKLNRIDERTAKTHDELTKYKGAFGLLVFLLSSLGIAGTLLKDWIKAHWH